jgi:ribosomal protein L30/L7E
VCLSNLENLNALFIQENAPQSERLRKLNLIAIHQMKLLTDHPSIKGLKAKDK